jgi:hypothetical protein
MSIIFIIFIESSEITTYALLRTFSHLLLGIIVEPLTCFPSQVTGPDHFLQQGAWPIFGVPQFFIEIVLNHQEGV